MENKKRYINTKPKRRIIKPISIELEVFNFIRYFALIEVGTSASNLINQHFKVQMRRYKQGHPDLDFKNMVFSNANGTFKKALKYGNITEEEFEALKQVYENQGEPLAQGEEVDINLVTDFEDEDDVEGV